MDSAGHRHPATLDFFDQVAIEAQADRPVRSQYSVPGAPRSQIPDAIIVAQATYSTINKWAPGISDTYALCARKGRGRYRARSVADRRASAMAPPRTGHSGPIVP
jgi:hypothetical protein